MADHVVHIAGELSILAHTLGLTDNPKALCGARITGAPDTAPMCPHCWTRAGWTHDRRHR